MKLPFLQFFPSDYMRDTRVLSLAAKGGWVDVLCMLHGASTRGTMRLPLVGWARVMGATVDQAASVLSELETMQVADVIRDCNGDVTLSSRRMLRERISKEQTRLRVQRHRNSEACNANGNADVTDKKSETKKSETKNNTNTGAVAPVAEEPLIFPLLLNTPDFIAAWADWLAYRRERKLAPWKARTIAAQMAALAEMGPEVAVQSIRNSIQNGYQGIFAPKQTGQPFGQPLKRGGTSTYEQEKKAHGYTL